MWSVVEICNIALAGIRGKSINALTEASLEAQQCKLHYDLARKFVLKDTDWQFARKIVPLALSSIEPLHWVYAYAYPGDCLHIRHVTGDFAFKNQIDTEFANRLRYIDQYIEPELSVPYEIQNDGADNKIIACDQADAYVIYTRNVTNTTLFDSQMVTALAQYLGSMIAIPIMGGDIGRAMRKEALELYARTLSSAIASNMNEQRQPKRREPSLVTMRK